MFIPGLAGPHAAMGCSPMTQSVSMYVCLHLGVCTHSQHGGSYLRHPKRVSDIEDTAQSSASVQLLNHTFTAWSISLRLPHNQVISRTHVPAWIQFNLSFYYLLIFVSPLDIRLMLKFFYIAPCFIQRKGNCALRKISFCTV